MQLPRLRLSLRSAFVALSIVAILCVYGGRAMRQQQSVAYIESTGGGVLTSRFGNRNHHRQFRARPLLFHFACSPSMIHLAKVSGSDSKLAQHMGRLTTAEALRMPQLKEPEAPVNVATWMPLQKLRRLRHLMLPRSELLACIHPNAPLESAEIGGLLAPEDAERLARYGSLRMLRAEVDSAPSVKAIGTMRGLTTLSLADSQVPPEAYEALGTLTNLEVLVLTGGSTAEKALPHVAGLPKLKTIRLKGSDVTDDTLASLASLKGVEVIDLRESAIRGEGLMALKDLESLIVVYVPPHAQMNVEAVTTFGAACPDVAVNHRSTSYQPSAW